MKNFLKFINIPLIFLNLFLFFINSINLATAEEEEINYSKEIKIYNEKIDDLLENVGSKYIHQQQYQYLKSSQKLLKQTNIELCYATNQSNLEIQSCFHNYIKYQFNSLNHDLKIIPVSNKKVKLNYDTKIKNLDKSINSTSQKYFQKISKQKNLNIKNFEHYKTYLIYWKKYANHFCKFYGDKKCLITLYRAKLRSTEYDLKH